MMRPQAKVRRKSEENIPASRVPLVSVVIPTYNYAEYLPQAIESVLNQTFLDFEIVVVDDGSTDDTPSVVRQFGDRIRYVRQENRGNACARNRGMAEARGQWLCFLDADDLWEPRKLELQLNHMLRNNVKVSCAKGRRFYESGGSEDFPPDPTDANLWTRLVASQPFTSSHSGLMLHRSCFEEIGCFDESLKLSVDWDLFIRLANRYRIRTMSEPLVYHRKHSTNTTGNHELRLKMYLVCLEKHKQLFCIERGMRREWHESYGSRLLRFGRYLLVQGRLLESTLLLMKSLRFGGRSNLKEKLFLLIECGLWQLGLGKVVKWAESREPRDASTQ